MPYILQKDGRKVPFGKHLGDKIPGEGGFIIPPLLCYPFGDYNRRINTMNYSKFRFTLDTHKHQSQVSVPIMRGDTAVQLYITLTDGGQPYTIGQSCFAILIGNKPDGTTFRHPCIIEGGGTIIRYDFQPDTSDLSGAVLCEVRLYGTNGILTAPCFTMVVDERIPHYDENISAEVISAHDRVFLNEVARVAAENERVKADKGRWEYLASLYYPALDGIIALQDGLISMGTLYHLNEDGKSYTCVGGLNIEAIEIADAVGDKPVTAIAPFAFKNYDKLRKVTIPANIKELGDGAFSGCTALEEIYFNATAMNDIFTEAERKYITENGTYWQYPFYEVGIATKGTHLYIGENVTRIPGMLFQFWTVDDSKISNLTAITFLGNSKCEEIAQRAFYSNFDISELILPDSVKTVGIHAFRKCRIQNLSLGSVQTLGAASFSATHISTVTLPSTLTTIQHDVFKGCPYLEEVIFTSKPNFGSDPYIFGNPKTVDEFGVPENALCVVDRIYVTWGEDDPINENAPWGATGATIHYNSEA